MGWGIIWDSGLLQDVPVSVPEGLRDVIALAPGENFTVALLGEPLHLSVPVLQNGNFHFEVMGAVNGNVAVEHSTNLVHWATLTNLMILNGEASFSIPIVTNDEQRFYRLRKE